MNGGFEFLCSNVLAKETEIPVFLSCVSLAELEPFQGFLTGISVPSAAAWLKLRPKPWLKRPLQLPRYQGLLLSHFVPAQQGALCRVLNISAVGCGAFSLSDGTMVKWFPLPSEVSKLPNH